MNHPVLMDHRRRWLALLLLCLGVLMIVLDTTVLLCLFGAAFAALAGGLGAVFLRAGRLADPFSSSQPEGEPA